MGGDIEGHKPQDMMGYVPALVTARIFRERQVRAVQPVHQIQQEGAVAGYNAADQKRGQQQDKPGISQGAVNTSLFLGIFGRHLWKSTDKSKE
jgi:hypothetical protein